jgi:hypothetical protein
LSLPWTLPKSRARSPTQRARSLKPRRLQSTSRARSGRDLGKGDNSTVSSLVQQLAREPSPATQTRRRCWRILNSFITLNTPFSTRPLLLYAPPASTSTTTYPHISSHILNISSKYPQLLHRRQHGRQKIRTRPAQGRRSVMVMIYTLHGGCIASSALLLRWTRCCILPLTACPQGCMHAAN